MEGKVIDKTQGLASLATGVFWGKNVRVMIYPAVVRFL